MSVSAIAIIMFLAETLMIYSAYNLHGNAFVVVFEHQIHTISQGQMIVYISYQVTPACVVHYTNSLLSIDPP